MKPMLLVVAAPRLRRSDAGAARRCPTPLARRRRGRNAPAEHPQDVDPGDLGAARPDAASRFRPRIGQAANVTPPSLACGARRSSRSTASAPQRTAVAGPHEFRQVISVDGRGAIRRERPPRPFAGHAIPDDRIRKRMLEDFARHGLVDIATDYGSDPAGVHQARPGEHEDRVRRRGPRSAPILPWLLRWKQNADGGELEFHGRQAVAPRRSRAGSGSASPTACRCASRLGRAYRLASHMIRDQATVDYMLSPHGFLTPVSVVHRHLMDGQLITENLYRYEPFKMFSADAEIKFTESRNAAAAARPAPRNDPHPVSPRLRFRPVFQQSPLFSRPPGSRRRARRNSRSGRRRFRAPHHHRPTRRHEARGRANRWR